MDAVPHDQPVEVILVLDRSGSMESIWADTIGGLKAFVDEFRQSAPHARFTLVLFNDAVSTLYASIPAAEVPEIKSGGELVPSNRTAMFDGICSAIDGAGKRFAEYPEDVRSKLRVVCAIISDGIENASREYRRDDVKQRVQRQAEQFGWQFNYLGANQDAIVAGGGLGIDAGRSAGYSANAHGIREALVGSSKRAVDYAVCGASGAMNISDEERRKLNQ